MAYTIFENAALFDGISSERKEPVFVLVEGNSIKEISSHPISMKVADRIDCRGATLMPGLIDAHVHVYLESLALSPPDPPISYRAHYAQRFLRHILSCGFTSVRDVAGGDHGTAMALRDRFFEGPRFFYGGLCLTQTGGHGDMRPMSQPTDYFSCGAEHNVLAVRADGVDDCIKAAREELRKGASHIKIMGSGGVLSPSDPLDRCQYTECEIRAIVEECRRHGAYVCAHCHPSESIRRCVEFGVRSIEHGTLIDEPTADFVVQKRAYVVPTLSSVFALMKNGAEFGMAEVSRQKLLRVHEYALKGLEIMKKAGVKVGFGTDLLGDQNSQRDMEFEIRREVMTPYEILRSATAVNAEILQMEGKLGTVAVGAMADLLVVDGNPLENLEVLRCQGSRITHIMLDGRLVKRPIH